ncbi:MAG TPA: Ig-like domain-containing protein [Staphylococcus saprophyticus]|nr:Ig-like domain-containing protein [Staphylococcus saprophyticus]
MNEVGLQGIKDKSKESLPASALRTIKVEKTDSKQVNGQDVSNKLEDVKTNITDSKGKALEDNQNVEPENGDILRANYSFKLPNDSVKSGDGFKIHFSDNLNLYGTTDPNFMNNHAHEEGRSIPDLMDQDGDIIATTSNKVTDRDILYTFTSNIDGKEDISASLSIPVFIDPKNVPNDSQQELETNIGSKTYSKDVNVKYRTFNNDIQSENSNLNGEAFIDKVNLDNNTFRHTIYINPLGKNIGDETVTISNCPKTDSEVNYNNHDTKIKIYELNNQNSFPTQSMYFDPDTAKDVTDALAENMHFYGNKLYLELPGNDPYDSGKYNDKKYVVQYTTTFKPEKDIQTRVLFGTTYYKYGDPQAWTDSYYWDNANSLYRSLQEATSSKVGYFQEHDIYETVDSKGNVISVDDRTDGKLVNTTTSDYAKDVANAKSGTSKESYEVTGTFKDGYKLVKVVPDNENPVSDMTTDKNSKITSGHYVAGKTLVITYIWVKDTKSPEPVVPTPSEPTKPEPKVPEEPKTPEPSESSEPVKKVHKKHVVHKKHQSWNKNSGIHAENNRWTNNYVPQGESWSNDYKPYGENSTQSKVVNESSHKTLSQTGERHSIMTIMLGSLLAVTGLMALFIDDKRKKN